MNRQVRRSFDADGLNPYNPMHSDFLSCGLATVLYTPTRGWLFLAEDTRGFS